MKVPMNIGLSLVECMLWRYYVNRWWAVDGGDYRKDGLWNQIR